MKGDYSQLLIDIQRKSNINITKVRDITFLKEEIENTIDTKIGFNTLRRLFGFLESNSPSKTTLNRLSNYLGFSSYSNYLNNKTNYNDWYFQQYLLQLRKEKIITQNAIDTINSGITNENNLVYLAYFICQQLENGHKKNVIKLFSNLQVQTINETQLQKFGLIIATSLELQPRKKAFSIYESLLPFDSFRETVLLMHVDYSNLHDRYAHILSLVAQFSTSDSEQFFVQLMMAYKAFYIEIRDHIIPIDIPRNFDKYFVTLKGRYFGVCLLFEVEPIQKIKSDLRKACQLNKVSYFLIEVIPALIMKEEYDFLAEILENYYEEVFDCDVWSSETTNAIYLIGLAAVNWQNKNFIGAQRNLDLVDLDKVELGYTLYVRLFYNLILLKISFAIKNSQLNKTYWNELQRLVKLTKFKRFHEVAFPYLL